MKALGRLFPRGGVRLTITAVAALTAVLGTVTPASAASTVSVTYNVKVSGAGLSDTGPGAVSLTASAPATVAPGRALTVKVTSGSFAVPGTADGVTVVSIKSVKLKVNVPANSTYVSCALTGGSGIGSGKPTCSDKSGTVTFSIPGPIPGGTTVTPPTMTLHLKAGQTGSIKSKMGGTSYSKPGLSATIDISVAGVPVTATAVGYPSPNPVLTTTKIT